MTGLLLLNPEHLTKTLQSFNLRGFTLKLKQETMRKSHKFQRCKHNVDLLNTTVFTQGSNSLNI